MNEDTITIIYLAGGLGSRVNSQHPKQFEIIHGRPLWYYAAHTIATTFQQAKWIFVFPASHMKSAVSDCALLFPNIKNDHKTFAEGGKTRYHSVKNALAYANGEGITFVHDAARCFLSQTLLLRLYRATSEHKNAIPYIQPQDSIRFREVSNQSVKALERSSVLQLQTPQVFNTEILCKSYWEHPHNNMFTDDASVVEKSGFDLHWVQGDRANIKITYAEDLKLAQILLNTK